MMYCIECGNRALICYCEFKAVTEENYSSDLEECKDMKCYCIRHLPYVDSSTKYMHSFSNTLILPDDFLRWIESDLNKVTRILPDYLKKKYPEITEHRKYKHIFEFLIGWCIGTCELCYLSAYQIRYNETPSEIQITEIRKIISRRKIQIEQGILAFLKENSRMI